MVYSSRFVLCVLKDGKPLKELANGVIPIIFGSEYALRFRNKNNRRAVVKFTIDGENVSGNGYVIPANSSIDILRHWDKDATFRFVDLDSPEAVDHGKNGPNLDGSKGVIEAKFFMERDYPVKVLQPIHHHHHYHERQKTWNPNPWLPLPNSCVPYSPRCSTNFTAPPPANMNVNVPPMVFPCLETPATLQEGCTVEGGRSGQTFSSEYIDLETDFVILRCILKGLPNTQVYTPPSTVELYCGNCGAKKTRPTDNFCGVCGRKF